MADLGGTPEATLPVSVQRSSFPSATLANAFDYDDFGGFGHPTMAIATTGRSEVANLTPEPSQVPRG